MSYDFDLEEQLDPDVLEALFGSDECDPVLPVNLWYSRQCGDFVPGDEQPVLHEEEVADPDLYLPVGVWGDLRQAAFALIWQETEEDLFSELGLE